MERDDLKRYFIVFYKFYCKDGDEGLGHTMFTTEDYKFLNKKTIFNTIKNDLEKLHNKEIKGVIFTNIRELLKEDYDEWNR